MCRGGDAFFQKRHSPPCKTLLHKKVKNKYNNTMGKLTVTIVCDVSGRDINGTSIAAQNLIDGLKRDGHNVRVLCCDETRRGEDGYYVCPRRSFGIFNGYVRHVGITLAKPDMTVVRAALDGADIAHCMLPFALSKATVRIAREMGIPVTAGFHCQAENFTSHFHLMNSRIARRLTYKYFYKKFYKDVACVHYPSQLIRDIFEGATEPTNGRVISNGVDEKFYPAAVSADDGRFIIFCSGRYSREKRQDLLIKAVGRSKYKDRIRLILAGKGALDKKYKRMVRRRGLTGVTMRFFDRDEMADALRGASLYVHTASAELEGIAVLEAVGSGLPILVSDSDNAAPRLLARDERNLFSAKSAKDLSRKIDYWIEHPKELAECAEYYSTNGAPKKDECIKQLEEMLINVSGAGAE